MAISIVDLICVLSPREKEGMGKTGVDPEQSLGEHQLLDD